MLGPSELKPIWIAPPGGMLIGVLAGAELAELDGVSVAEAELLAFADLPAEAEPVPAGELELRPAEAEPGELAEPVLAAELLTAAELLVAVELDSPADGVWLAPVLLTRTLWAAGLDTDCSWISCGPLLMTTICSWASPPWELLLEEEPSLEEEPLLEEEPSLEEAPLLEESLPVVNGAIDAIRMEMAPASAEAPSTGGRWLTVWALWPAAQPATSTAALTAIAAAAANRRLAPDRPGNSFATLSSSSASQPRAAAARPFRLSVASREWPAVDRVAGRPGCIPSQHGTAGIRIGTALTRNGISLTKYGTSGQSPQPSVTARDGPREPSNQPAQRTIHST